MRMIRVRVTLSGRRRRLDAADMEVATKAEQNRTVKLADKCIQQEYVVCGRNALSQKGSEGSGSRGCRAPADDRQVCSLSQEAAAPNQGRPPKILSTAVKIRARTQAAGSRSKQAANRPQSRLKTSSKSRPRYWHRWTGCASGTATGKRPRCRPTNKQASRLQKG